MNVQGDQIDMEQLCEDLIRVVLNHYVDDLNNEVPMSEIRRAFDEAGVLTGRIIAAARHEGPISGDLLMEMRTSEEEHKAKFAHSVRLFGPGQKLRTHLEGMAQQCRDDK